MCVPTKSFKNRKYVTHSLHALLKRDIFSNNNNNKHQTTTSNDTVKYIHLEMRGDVN